MALKQKMYFSFIIKKFDLFLTKGVLLRQHCSAKSKTVQFLHWKSIKTPPYTIIYVKLSYGWKTYFLT